MSLPTEPKSATPAPVAATTEPKTAAPAPVEPVVVAAPTTARIELFEWSGPVSPRYQYTTKVLVEAGAGGATVSYSDEGVYVGGEPTRRVVGQGPLPREAFEALAAELLSMDVFGLGGAPSPELAARVGISVNRLDVQLGERSMRLEYTLAALKKPEQAAQRALIERVRKLVGCLATAPEGS